VEDALADVDGVVWCATSFNNFRQRLPDRVDEAAGKVARAGMALFELRFGDALFGGGGRRASDGQGDDAQDEIEARRREARDKTADVEGLELALQAGHLGCLRVLLQQSCVDVNGITKRGSSLLHFAAELGDDARVSFLLSMHAQVDVVNPNGETPLHWACSLGQLNVVRCLVQHGADPLLHERVQGLTPLHAACSARGQPAVLALLIQRCEFMQWNSQPQRSNLLDIHRNTPLHTCAKEGFAECAARMLEVGASASEQNHAGRTAQQEAEFELARLEREGEVATGTRRARLAHTIEVMSLDAACR